MPVNPPPKQFVHGQILHSELRNPAFAHASYGIRAAANPSSDFRAPNAGESCVILRKRRKTKITEKCLSLSSVLRCFVYIDDEVRYEHKR